MLINQKEKISSQRTTWFIYLIKRALNPNFLNLTINREKFWLKKRFGPISYLAFVKKLKENYYLNIHSKVLLGIRVIAQC